jgi:hypothetical protein
MVVHNSPLGFGQADERGYSVPKSLGERFTFLIQIERGWEIGMYGRLLKT